MIEVNCFEEVIQIKTGTAFAGEVRNWATVYLVDGLLIDTGCHNAREDLAQFLQDHPVKLVVNTHYHEDHIGANHILQNRFGARLMASAESVPLINQVPEMYRIREILWGTPQPTVVDCLPPRIQTDRFCFDVIDTPGHCRGHVVLLERTKGWCFSGDLFVAREPRLFRPVEEDLTETVRSMRKLLDLGTERLVLFTSMGGVEWDGREALQSCLENYRRWSERAKQLEKQGLSAPAIRDELFGGESSIAEITNGDMSSEHLVHALLGAEI